jgi:PST family polysaccharide transporter
MTEQSPPLRDSVRRAVSWNLAGVVVGRGGTLVSGLVLARLLAPEDYGVFAVALVALLFVANLNDLGVEQVLVRWPGPVTGVAPTARTVILGSSALQFALLFLAAPSLAGALGAPEAAGVIRLLAASIVVGGAFAVHSALLTRDLRLGRRTTADVIGLVAGLGLTLGLAVSGAGVWSLAWGRVAGNTLTGVLHACLSGHRVPFRFEREVARRLTAQGLPLAGATIVTVAVLNTDTLVVGRVLGPVELGFYTMAFNLSSWPVSVFGVAAWRVAVAAFARLQADPERLRAAFLRALGMLLGVALPVCVLLAALAEPLIRFLYGARWLPAAGALTLLAGLGALRVALQLADDALVAVGRGATVLVLQLTWLAAVVPALALGASVGGIAGAALAHVLVALFVAVPLHLFALRPLGIGGFGIVRAVGRVAIGAAAALAVGRVAGSLLGGTDLVVLAVSSFATLGVYAVFAAPLRHELRSARAA